MSFAILLGPPIAGAVRSASPTGGFEGAGAYAGKSLMRKIESRLKHDAYLGSCVVVGTIFMVLTKRSATGKWIRGKI